MIPEAAQKEETVCLSPEQLAMVLEAEEDFESGISFTAEQVLENARARVRAWLPDHLRSAP